MAGQPRLGGAGRCSPLLALLLSPSINHTNSRLGGGERLIKIISLFVCKNTSGELENVQNWRNAELELFLPIPAGGDTKPGVGGKRRVWGSGMGDPPLLCVCGGVQPAQAAAGSWCAGFVPSTSLQGSCDATQNCIPTRYQRLCRNVSPVRCKLH